MQFNEYQESARETDQFSGPDNQKITHHLLNLTETVSYLSRLLEQELRGEPLREPHRTNLISRKLGDALWYISIIASRNNLTLDEVATNNIVITQKRWNKSRDMKGKSFDQFYPRIERLPQKIRIAFVADSNDQDRIILCVKLDGGDWMQIGDRVDDNAATSDGYRFHDVFHLSHVAFLGWSPVFRGLMKRKRKSNPDCDRIQDGARAMNLEEAATALIFSYAKEQAFFEGAKSIDFNLLKTVVRITDGLEVSQRSYEDWEKSILFGYQPFRDLQKHGEGVVIMDRTKKAADRLVFTAIDDQIRKEIGVDVKN
ncbi:hypothetical protein [Erythrobacter aurantius]|uniref:hypothetical protein n=1 Tax=Erythrobacter aurantius TaxID=2909249 RepID=UPI002079717F|nr:hypothetical protein [Erythrobacter aurantius]